MRLNIAAPLLAGAFAVLLAAAPRTAQADQPFLSVNFAADELVRIEPTSGAVTTVGPLGVNVEIGLTMTRYNGQLYLLDAGFGPLDPSLYTIDETTGAATLVASLSLPGSTIEYAEAVTADATGLLIIIDDEPGNSSRSKQITRPNLTTGVLTLLGRISGAAAGDMGDLDAMVHDPATGDLVGVDGAPTESRNLYRRVAPATGALTELDEYTTVELDGLVNGLHLEGTRLFAVTSGAGASVGSIVEVAYDGTNATLTTATPLVAPGGAYNGLVRAAGCNAADLNPDGVLNVDDVDDIDCFVAAFLAGCP